MTTGLHNPFSLDQFEHASADDRRAWAEAGAPGLLSVLEDLKRSVTVDLNRADRLSADLLICSDLQPDYAARARARSARAHVLAYANRLAEAAWLCEESAAVAHAHDLPFELAAARLSSVQPLSRLGRADDALRAATEAAALFTSLQQPVWAAKAEVNAGVILKLRDRHQDALACFDRAVIHFADNPAVIAQIQSNRAEALLELNQFSLAEAAFEQALAGFESTGNRRAASLVRGNRADLHRRLGRFDQSLHDYELALRAYEQEDAPGDLARLRAERAETLACVGMLPDAHSGFLESIPVLREHKLYWELARASLAHADLLLRLQRFKESTASLEDAASAFGSLNHHAGLAQVDALRATLALQAGRTDDARRLLRHAADAVRDRPAESVLMRIQLAVVLLSEPDTDDLPRFLDTLVTDARALGIPPLVAQALRTRGRFAASQRRYRDALDDFIAAMDEVEHTRSTLRTQEVRAAFLGDRLALYEDAVHTAFSVAPEPDIALAFDAIQRARARSFLDLLHADRVASTTPLLGAPGTHLDNATPLLQQHGALLDELRALYEHIERPDRHTPRADSGVRSHSMITAVERRLNAIELRLAASAEFADIYAAPLSLTAGARLPRRGALLLDFFTARGELLVIALREGHAPVPIVLGPVSQFTDLSRRLVFHIARAVSRASAARPLASTADDPSIRIVLTSLGSLLFGPLRPLLSGVSSIQVIPHGPLHEVPFEALIVDGRSLIDLATISYAPSISILDRLGARRAVSGPLSHSQPLVLGLSDERAPSIESEAAAVAESLGVEPILNADATFDAFVDRARSSPLIHLATHAVGARESPMNARLRFADGWATARDLSRLSLPGSLVVLSACETARGAVVGCDDTFGLIRAFLAAGAGSLLVTRWPIHDGAAASLMIHTYQHLASCGAESRERWGMPNSFQAFAASLRRAQQLAASAGHHPALWAPFMLIGNP